MIVLSFNAVQWIWAAPVNLLWERGHNQSPSDAADWFCTSRTLASVGGNEDHGRQLVIRNILPCKCSHFVSRLERSSSQSKSSTNRVYEQLIT